MKLKLSEITIDQDIQPRVSLDQHVLVNYKERMKEGDVFPAVVVYDDGNKKWLADGFHRYRSHQDLKRATIDVELRKGSKREAILCAIEANKKHGLRLSNADKRKCVLILLQDKKWRDWSNRKIASTAGVSSTLVNNIQSEMSDKTEVVEDGEKKFLVSQSRSRERHSAFERLALLGSRGFFFRHRRLFRRSDRATLAYIACIHFSFSALRI